MHLTTGIFLLRMIDKRMRVALHRLIATGRVRVEPTARLHRHIGCLLHRLDGEILHGLHHDETLSTDPGDDRGPIFIIMAPARLALLAATTRLVPQRLLPTLLCLSLLASGVVE